MTIIKELLNEINNPYLELGTLTIIITFSVLNIWYLSYKNNDIKKLKKVRFELELDEKEVQTDTILENKEVQTDTILEDKDLEFNLNDLNLENAFNTDNESVLITKFNLIKNIRRELEYVIKHINIINNQITYNEKQNSGINFYDFVLDTGTNSFLSSIDENKPDLNFEIAFNLLMFDSLKFKIRHWIDDFKFYIKNLNEISEKFHSPLTNTDIITNTDGFNTPISSFEEEDTFINEISNNLTNLTDALQ